MFKNIIKKYILIVELQNLLLAIHKL